jgi:hypothetical protein
VTGSGSSSSVRSPNLSWRALTGGVLIFGTLFWGVQAMSHLVIALVILAVVMWAPAGRR